MWGVRVQLCGVVGYVKWTARRHRTENGPTYVKIPMIANKNLNRSPLSLTEAKDELITQKQAAEQLQLSERQIRRLLRSLRQIGDRAVLHGLRGRSSNRKTSVEVEQRAIAELRDNGQCHDFGPSYATEHVRKTLEIQVSKDDGNGNLVDFGHGRVSHTNGIS